MFSNSWFKRLTYIYFVQIQCFQGRLSSGQDIAVKRLSRKSGKGNLEFKEWSPLGGQTLSLVRLLGFSLERTERLLVYEFVPNASLNCFIFGIVAFNLEFTYFKFNRVEHLLLVLTSKLYIDPKKREQLDYLWKTI